jgi:hypothetical protein
MNAINQSVSLLSIVLASLRVLARHGWASNGADNEGDMKRLSLSQLVELADTLHCLDGVSHSTMRKMGKGKLVSRIISEIGG